MHYSPEEERNKFTTILDEPSESCGGKCSFSFDRGIVKIYICHKKVQIDVPMRLAFLKVHK